MNNKKYDKQLYEFHYIETIKDFIVGSAYRCADEPAYMFKKKHDEPFSVLTYAEFDRMRKALGTALCDMGLSGSKIAVFGDNSHLWALAYFTVVTGVGVIVPIDKNLPQDEIENLLERADVELLFTSMSVAKTAHDIIGKSDRLKCAVILDEPDAYSNHRQDFETLMKDEKMLSLDSLIAYGEELIERGERGYIDAEIDQEDLSTILFTSGTTGLAKGVMLSHRNLAQNVFNMSKYVSIPEDGRVLSVLPMHHAYEMTCTVMTSFYQGRTVVICEGLKYIQKNFLEAKCAMMLGVPLVFENIYRKIWQKAKKSDSTEKLRRAIGISKRLNLKNNRAATRRLFRSVTDIFGDDLYLLISGGAAIDAAVIVEFEAMGLPIIQGYGMTECAPIIAVNQDRYSKAGAVGKPMPNTEVRVVDKDEYGIGEIICKGPSVMMGYYNDPENTAKAIRDGWLYTGDFGFLDDDGFLYVTGRKKNVIVTKGGKNIFPEEVEYYLLLSEYVNEVLVYGKRDPIKDDLICTAIIYPDYAVLKEHRATTDKEIYKKLSAAIDAANEKMTPYKRIKRFEVREDEFIKTTTLKIKRFEEKNYEYKFDSRTFEK